MGLIPIYFIHPAVSDADVVVVEHLKHLIPVTRMEGAP
jgi:hypothetical protein